MDLRYFINECVREALLEADIVPNDKDGEPNVVKNPNVNKWRMMYRLMDNVKTLMDNTWESKKGKISKKDIITVKKYIITSFQNIGV